MSSSFSLMQASTWRNTRTRDTTNENASGPNHNRNLSRQLTTKETRKNIGRQSRQGSEIEYREKEKRVVEPRHKKLIGESERKSKLWPSARNVHAFNNAQTNRQTKMVTSGRRWLPIQTSTDNKRANKQTNKQPNKQTDRPRWSPQTEMTTDPDEYGQQ